MSNTNEGQHITKRGVNYNETNGIVFDGQEIERNRKQEKEERRGDEMRRISPTDLFLKASSRN